MLEIEDLRAGYGHIEALSGVSLRVDAGEIVTLIGANGAGKSTLLMTVCGNPRARAGRIRFEGEDIAATPTHAIIQRGIAHAPEGRRVFSRMSVVENLRMGAVTAPPDRFEANVERAFGYFPLLRERRHQRGGTLSGGEQQMLAISRALMGAPRLLLLDEPSLGLAPMIVRQIFAVIREINRAQGITVLLVEQNAYHALRIAHRGYVMANGRIVKSGTGAELMDDREIRTAYLGERIGGDGAS